MYFLQGFKGVYPRDELPEITRKPAALIVNTDMSSLPGEQWIAIILKRNGRGEYFDSFGLPPLHKEIIKFLNENCPNGWCYNTVTLQHFSAVTCGYYCVGDVMLRCSGFRYCEYIQLFTTIPNINDNIIVNIINKIHA